MIFFLERRLGSPEKKAPLVLSNFAHLFHGHRNPLDSHGLPATCAFPYMYHFERSYPPQSAFVLSSRIVLPPAQEPAESPLQYPHNQICLFERAATPFYICSAITKSDCGHGCERGRLGLGSSEKNATTQPRSAGKTLGGKDLECTCSCAINYSTEC
ncbi:hypothetical protein N7490_007805 [Penicillium lividum]|nr:hypothetical protein N7490_007805 [Penicillium lividum]